ncbi:MAG: Holliday junction branch migration protein RuvA [Flavobacteriaceae bacterium]|nr:Holliday junction branch migration protein RuvA [Flavobacteriaceae bacterium]
MITHLKGKLVEKNPTNVVLDVNGIGYKVHISLNTFSELPATEEVFLHTYLHIKEDSHTLFGFKKPIEREIFKLLLSVSGVGTSTARTMLSSMTTDEVQKAIASGDVKMIQSVKGIGAKTAQRILIDLRDKIDSAFASDEILVSSSNRNRNEALKALEVLGFSTKQCERVIEQILKTDADLSVEELIKQALKKL